MVQAFSDILIYIYRAQAASDTISHLPSVPNKITENQKRLQKKNARVWGHWKSISIPILL